MIRLRSSRDAALRRADGSVDTHHSKRSMSSLRRCLLLLSLMTMATRAAAAQLAPRSAPPPDDSTTVAAVLGSALGSASAHIAAAAVSSSPPRWVIRVPDDSAAMWVRARAWLHGALIPNGRSANASGVEYLFEIRSVEVRGDSLRARYRIGESLGGRVSATTYELSAIWSGLAWSQRRVRPLEYED